MSEKKIAPYGSWTSPITADQIVQGSVGLGQVVVDRGDLYWSESRPSEKGRVTIMWRGADGEIAEVLPPEFGARSRVHEYGGGSYTVSGGVVYFVRDSDQCVWRRVPGLDPVALTAAGPARYADLVVDGARDRIIAVREDHRAGLSEPENDLVAIGADGSVVTLAHGDDFYASPRLSPDGDQLTWLSWSHPNMPWDGTCLWLATLDESGAPQNPRIIAGGPMESIFQPSWSADGTLYFVSDRSGWWNLYCWEKNGEPRALRPMEAEFGLPQWAFGMSSYTHLPGGDILAAYVQQGTRALGRINPKTGALRAVDTAFCDFDGPKALDDSDGFVAFLGASQTGAAQLVIHDLATADERVIRNSLDFALDPGDVSVAEAVNFESEGGATAHGFYYPPQNSRFTGEGPPPLIVKSHGGPTGRTGDSFSLKIQYWTSRGFAVLDVNYRGSTGFGRAYRQALDGVWGVADVDDCMFGAQYLVDRGLADPARLIITGGSAGGYTTLSALTFRDTFKAGASHYGIGDLTALAKDTHKFESRYLDRLVGPWPEAESLYRARSPIEHAEGLDCPVIFFQGLDDKVVPPNQAEEMVAVLREKGIPVAYIPFEGEGHGFRQAASIKRALEAELSFYGRVFDFAPADKIDPVEIWNL
jgi:dipeptidyl aminopeptidase/acylaminoacyl peptidase